MTRHRLFTLLITTLLASLTLLAVPREKNNILSLKNSITDDDIVFPESFDTDVHKMMTNWYLTVEFVTHETDAHERSVGLGHLYQATDCRIGKCLNAHEC